MTRAHKIMVIVVVATVGIWGCSQGESKSVSKGHLDRIKTLEAKCASLEQECLSAQTGRDQGQSRIGELEAECSRLLKEIHQQQQVVSKERDQLKQIVTVRTTERDALQGQLVELRQGIRTLLSRVESALPGENGDHKASMSPRL